MRAYFALDVDVGQDPGKGHLGSHQAPRPASAIAAGTSVMRTRNASNATPIASANAMPLMTPVPSGTKAKKTKNMMSAAAVTTRAACWKPCTIELRGSRVLTRIPRACRTRNTS